MPVSYVIHQGDHVYARYEGSVALADVTRMFAAYQQDPDFDRTLPHLVDLSRLTETDAGFAEMFALFAMYGRAYAAANARMRCAIFAPSDLTFGVSRIFENLAETSDWLDTAIFGNLEEATAWARGLPLPAPCPHGNDT